MGNAQSGLQKFRERKGIAKANDDEYNLTQEKRKNELSEIQTGLYNIEIQKGTLRSKKLKDKISLGIAERIDEIHSERDLKTLSPSKRGNKLSDS